MYILYVYNIVYYINIPSSTATLALASAKPKPARTMNIKLP